MLRLANTADEHFMYDLYFHPAVNAALLYEPMSREAFAPIFKQLLEQGIKYIFEINGEAVGMVKLVPLTHRTSHVCYVGGLAIHPAHAGKGCGTLLMQTIRQWAIEKGFKRLELDVDEDNPRAKRLYEKAGYITEGVLRKYAYRKTVGQYFDNFRMALLLD
jgi:putative acetyltransferase